MVNEMAHPRPPGHQRLGGHRRRQNQALRLQAFYPGPGIGGHCLPIDPFYLAFKAREHDFYPEFIELAGKMNQAQPVFCVERIERALNDAGRPVKDSKILILGMSYKAGVGDTRESPALKIATLLRDLGGEVPDDHPHVPELASLGLSSVDLDEALSASDVVAIPTRAPEPRLRGDRRRRQGSSSTSAALPAASTRRT